MGHARRLGMLLQLGKFSTGSERAGCGGDSSPASLEFKSDKLPDLAVSVAMRIIGAMPEIGAEHCTNMQRI